MRRAALLPAPMLALALLAACGGEAPTSQPSGSPTPESLRETLEDPLATPAALPPQVADYPALSSRTCTDVVRFYTDAIAAREWDKAALVWADPVIDGARLESIFGSYRLLSITWGEPTEEGAAGSLYCTVEGTLTDKDEPAKGAVPGTLVLRRVNDVDGATPTQLRWTIRSSSFIEPLERSGRSS